MIAENYYNGKRYDQNAKKSHYGSFLINTLKNNVRVNK
jgi:hypothetical protein